MEGPNFIIINFGQSGAPNVGGSEPTPANSPTGSKRPKGGRIFSPTSPLAPEVRLKEMNNIFDTLLNYQR